MEEIVTSVKRVTDIIGRDHGGESGAKRSIEQVNIAINQMDQVTQQNAALVEQAAAAHQCAMSQLAETVAVFKLNHTRTTQHAASQARIHRSVRRLRNCGSLAPG
jgi:methyl-accepting chemotaxis protein